MIVGENSPVPGDEPLNACVVGSTGHRLWRMILLHTPLTTDDYHEVFDRRNLCRQAWSQAEAERVAQVIATLSPPGQVVVLLGSKVQDCFGIREQINPRIVAGTTYYGAPHPSGLNRWYNDGKNRSVVGKLLAELYLSYRRSECQQTTITYAR